MAFTTAATFVFFGLLSTALAADSTPTPPVESPVKVALYFESYCPDSVKFLTKQLYPAYVTSLKDHMTISLVPYGKATKGDDGKITCHHGEHECFGNKVIACALKNPALNFADVFKFINCTSSTIAADPKRSTYPIAECVQGTAISADAIDACAKNPDEGDKYLAEYGEQTDKVAKPLASVPTVVFNEKFDANESKDAVENFRKALCSKIKTTGVAECVGGGAAGLQIAILPLAAAVLVATRV